MRASSSVAAVLGLLAFGLAVPVTSAEATTQGPGCSSKWPGRDGYVRAWADPDCSGTLLGATQGGDYDWSDGIGAFTGSDWGQASSVMNSGTIGGKDVVAFYWNYGQSDVLGYTCLAPGEKYADNLTDNVFQRRNGTEFGPVDDNIGSHVWVAASACASNSWLT
ncbi:hypothetical protein ACIO1C_00140 [Streptomyces sp. NPDC087420]|uniref:hypothetical protein n=1 Tax=Streptomyces sp. NPDC087420 TaxID=3365785 RepID=UPI003838D80D